MIIVTIICSGFAAITGLIYLKRTIQINKMVFESKQNVNISKIKDVYDKYTFITSEDTFYVSKEYQPDLDRKAIEEIDLDENFNIQYASTELVSLKNNSQKVFDIDLVKIKIEKRNAAALEAFYWCMVICSSMMLGFIFVPLEKRVIQKVETNILKIPNTIKIKDQLFQYSYKNIDFLLSHQYSPSAHYIRIYIPVNAENLIHPNNMHTEKIDNKPYCYFEYRIFTSKVAAKKIQAKIDAKFNKV